MRDRRTVIAGLAVLLVAGVVVAGVVFFVNMVRPAAEAPAVVIETVTVHVPAPTPTAPDSVAALRQPGPHRSRTPVGAGATSTSSSVLSTSSTPTSTSSTPTSTSSTSTSKAIDPARVADAVADAVEQAKAAGITESVEVLDRHTGAEIYASGEQIAMPAVSIAKLLFAVDEIRQAGGGANLGPGRAQTIFTMISQSDDNLADAYYGSHGEGDIVTRVAAEYGLHDTNPAPNPRYWGGITTTAADVASLLRQALADPTVGPYLAPGMRAATPTFADGYDQTFGMNAVTGAGSKQGWGCCLGGVVAIHSAGFTADEIVVVLSAAAPDATGLNVPDVSAFADDPGFLASVTAVTRTIRAAVRPDG